MSEAGAIKAFCHTCDHDWVAAFSGMSLTKTAELLRRADMCPKCGSTEIFAGPRRQPQQEPPPPE